MKVFSTKLQGRDFKVAVAITDKERVKGLSDTNHLKKDAGMLFVFDKLQEVTFNTFKMNYPIDMVFLDENMMSLDYKIMYPGTSTAVGDVKYVLEVNAGALPVLQGVQLNIGDEELTDYLQEIETNKDVESVEEDSSDDIVDKSNAEEAEKEEEEITEDEHNMLVTRINDVEIFKTGGKITPIEKDLKSITNHMQVLDDTGVVLMNIKGGERIFSRIHTKQLVDMAAAVRKGKKTAKDMGKLMADIVATQDNTEPEYVYE